MKSRPEIPPVDQRSDCMVESRAAQDLLDQQLDDKPPNGLNKSRFTHLLKGSENLLRPPSLRGDCCPSRD